MPDVIPCDGKQISWFRRRKLVQWYFLWISDDDQQELEDLLQTISASNVRDLRQRFESAKCENPTCRLHSSDIKIVDPAESNHAISYNRPIFFLGLGIEVTVFDKRTVEVWCERAEEEVQGEEEITVLINGQQESIFVTISPPTQQKAQVMLQLYSRNNAITNEQLEPIFRWSQIIVEKQPLIPANQDLPRFDVGISERETQGLPQGDPGRLLREKKKNDHNPFQGSRMQTNRIFFDEPNVTGNPPQLWESYIMLFEITTQGGLWRANILRVWKWKYDQNALPRSSIITIDRNDSSFRQALNAAILEFQSAFTENTNYPLPVPDPR